MSTNKPTVEDLRLLVTRLQAEFPLIEDASYKPLVNFSMNRSLPIHSWFDYKQGYSPELIQKLVEDLGVPKNGLILDPFNGVGTTLLAADLMGISSVGFDVNPVAVLASEVKSRKYSDQDLAILKIELAKFNEAKPKPILIPNYRSLPRIYSDKQLNDLLVVRAFVDRQLPEWVRKFFLLAFISIVEPISNRIKDGNGIKIVKNKKPVEDVFGLYHLKVLSMIKDLELVKPNGLGKTIYGSIYKQVDDNMAVGLGLNYYSLGSINLRDGIGTSLGTQNPNEFGVDIALSKKFGVDFAVGATVRYIRSDVFDVENAGKVKSANATAIDVGLFKKHRIGYNILNVGFIYGNLSKPMVLSGVLMFAKKF